MLRLISYLSIGGFGAFLSFLGHGGNTVEFWILLALVLTYHLTAVLADQ